MILLRRSVLMVLVMLVLPSFCLAGWVGPKEIITGAWGSGDKEFGYKSDEIKDYFPTTIKFFQDGKILIYDPINTKINIYDNKGVYAKTITTSGIVLSAI